MRFNKTPDMDDSLFLNKKYHKDFQHIVGIFQWLTVVGIFDLAYVVSLMSRFSSAPQEYHLDLARRIFGSLIFFQTDGIQLTHRH